MLLFESTKTKFITSKCNWCNNLSCRFSEEGIGAHASLVVFANEFVVGRVEAIILHGRHNALLIAASITLVAFRLIGDRAVLISVRPGVVVVVMLHALVESCWLAIADLARRMHFTACCFRFLAEVDRVFLVELRLELLNTSLKYWFLLFFLPLKKSKIC